MRICTDPAGHESSGMEDINKKVFLLRMLTGEVDETMHDVVASLANTGMFTLEEGMALKKELEENDYIVDGKLSFKGAAEARKAEQEFRL